MSKSVLDFGLFEQSARVVVAVVVVVDSVEFVAFLIDFIVADVLSNILKADSSLGKITVLVVTILLLLTMLVVNLGNLVVFVKRKSKLFLLVFGCCGV